MAAASAQHTHGGGAAAIAGQQNCNEITLGQQLNSSGMLELSFKNKAAAAAAMQALIHPAESATALLCDSLQLLP